MANVFDTNRGYALIDSMLAAIQDHRKFNWKKFRAEAAKDFYCTSINVSIASEKEVNLTEYAKFSVEAADILIDELKKKGDEK